MICNCPAGLHEVECWAVKSVKQERFSREVRLAVIKKTGHIVDWEAERKSQWEYIDARKRKSS